MDLKNKKDEELVSDAWKTTSGRINSVEMMRRLKNSIEKLDKTTVSYSRILICLTMVLIIVAIAQIFVSIISLSYLGWIMVLIELAVAGFIFYFCRKVIHEFVNKT